jgi:predicted DNA-binding protein
MPRRKKPRTSGPTIPEDRRVAKQTMLRLPDSTRDALDALAARWETTRSGAVVRLVSEAEK